MPKKGRTLKGSLRFDPKVFLARLHKGTTTTGYVENRKVFTQGDVCDSVFYVARGRVRLSVVSSQGKEAVVALLNGGSFFGEGCLTGQTVRPATATTATPCILTRIPKTTMIRVLRESREFSGYFVSYLLKRTRRVEEDLVDHLFNSSEQRLARVLMLLAHFGKNGRTETVMPRVNQETLAGMVGTTRARVNHFMNKFRQLGFIEYDRHSEALSIHSSLVNVILHD